MSAIAPVASLAMAIWFGWSLLKGEDSIPAAVNVAAFVGALIVIVDAGRQLYVRSRDRSA